jgi:hypothetical protein
MFFVPKFCCKAIGIGCLMAVLAAGLPATARGEGPVGSAYLQTLPLRAPRFGELIQDVYPYEGVRIQRWRRADDVPADWLVVWIDLQTPGLGYSATPVHYRLGPAGDLRQAVYAETTAEFLRAHSDPPRTDLAVNTVAYWPFPAFHGKPVFLSDPVWIGSDNQRDPDPGSLMLALLPGRALIGEVEEVRAARPLYAFGAFIPQGGLGADGTAVRRGRVECTPEEPHGRTAAGVSADGRVLLLLVADGYNPGVSIGLSKEDTGEVLAAAGAYNALFLDAGGSSTLVGRDDAGNPAVLNRPAGLQKVPGTLRYVATNLGFTNLRRTADPLPAIPDWEAPSLSRNWAKLVAWGRSYPRKAMLLFGGLAVLGLVTAAGWLRRRWARAHPPPAIAGPLLQPGLEAPTHAT